MEKFIIHGGGRLEGDVTISGAKNSALPILAATLAVEGTVVLRNVPRLTDISTILEILNRLGLKTSTNAQHDVTIHNQHILNCCAPYELVRAMRASILILGPLLARHGYAKIAFPGGCAIGSRPVDLHLDAMRALGASIEIKDGFIHASSKGRLKGSNFTFSKVTVTGTENMIMAACLARGTTIIRNAAKEPEIIDLADALNKFGAQISGAGTDTIEIIGVDTLKGGEHVVIPDRIETGTFLVAGAITQGKIKLLNSNPYLVDSVLVKLAKCGAQINTGKDWIEIDMLNKRPRAIDISTSPYPGFPTDMQAQFTVLNAVAEGNSTITETVFENRFMHIRQIQKMGANLAINGKQVYCQGVERLRANAVEATDLRASASLVLAGLVADGETEISEIYHIDRGYEKIEEKLGRIGGKIYRKPVQQDPRNL